MAIVFKFALERTMLGFKTRDILKLNGIIIIWSTIIKVIYWIKAGAP
jgi:hypothetical protein